MQPDPDAADLEALWRDPAMAALGFSADWNGVGAYVEDIRARFGTRWTFCGFFTKYPLGHFAYASIGGPRLVMDYNNDGWGPDNIDRVFAHETGHIFGCPDEYAGSGCNCGGAWGRFGLANGNCENCAGEGGVPCLMKGNTFAVCGFTPGHFGWAPQLVVRNFGYDAGGWRVNMHPRIMADTSGDGRADIVGFGDHGVWVSRAQPDGHFETPQLVINNFGYHAGGWRVEKHPRFMADTTGDGRADIVGFGNAGVYVSRAQADGTFGPSPASSTTSATTPAAGGSNMHPRFVADTTGDGRADIVGFGNAGVYVSLAQAGRQLRPGHPRRRQLRLQRRRLAGREPSALPRRHHRQRPARHRRVRQRRGLGVARPGRTAPTRRRTLVVGNFGYDAGGWRVESHPRFVADINGDGRADIVGFGNAGVYVALAQADGSYRRRSPASSTTSATTPAAGGWRATRASSPTPPAMGVADIVGFGNAGVWVSRALAGGGYDAPGLIVTNFGYDAGGWRVESHPRFVVDTTGDGRADIVGFGNAGVWMHRS